MLVSNVTLTYREYIEILKNRNGSLRLNFISKGDAFTIVSEFPVLLPLMTWYIEYINCDIIITFQKGSEHVTLSLDEIDHIETLVMTLYVVETLFRLQLSGKIKVEFSSVYVNIIKIDSVENDEDDNQEQDAHSDDW